MIYLEAKTDVLCGGAVQQRFLHFQYPFTGAASLNREIRKHLDDVIFTIF